MQCNTTDPIKLVRKFLDQRAVFRNMLCLVCVSVVAVRLRGRTYQQLTQLRSYVDSAVSYRFSCGLSGLNVLSGSTIPLQLWTFRFKHVFTLTMQFETLFSHAASKFDWKVISV